MHKFTNCLLACVISLTAALPLYAQEETQSAEDKLQSIMQELNAGYRKWMMDQRAKMKKAQEAAEKAKAEGKDAPEMPAVQMRPGKDFFAPHLKKIQDGAAAYKGTDDAIQYHLMILQIAGASEDKAAGMAAADALTTDHIKSEKLEEAIMGIHFSTRLIGQDKATAYLEKIAKESPHANIRAEAFLAPLRSTLDEAPVDSAAYKEAKEKGMAYAKEKNDKALMSAITAIVNGREKLVAGGEAMDISGVDLDGTAFKLSDYKGKIILLDFWGDW